MDSNAPTSSLSERIKTEPCSDGGDLYDCYTTNGILNDLKHYFKFICTIISPSLLVFSSGNGRCSPVNLTVSSRHKEDSALVRLLVNGTSSPVPPPPRHSSPPHHNVSASPTNLVVRPHFATNGGSGGGDTCGHCKIRFPDRTLYFLHKGCHAEGNPWKCNICGEQTSNVYDFNSHLLSSKHQ